MITKYECSCGESFTNEQDCLQHEKSHEKNITDKDVICAFKSNMINLFTGKNVSEVKQILYENFHYIMKTLCDREITEKCGMDESINLHLSYLKECEQKKNFTFFITTFIDEQSGSEYNVISMTDSNTDILPLRPPRYKMNVGSGISLKTHDAPLSGITGGIIVSILFKKGMHPNMEIELG